MTVLARSRTPKLTLAYHTMKSFALCMMLCTSAVLTAEGDLYAFDIKQNKTVVMKRVPYVTYTVLAKNVINVNGTELPCKNGVLTRVTTEVNVELRVTESKTMHILYGPTWEKHLVATDGMPGDLPANLIDSAFGIWPIEKWNFVPLYNKSENRSGNSPTPYGRFDQLNEWTRLEIEKYNEKGQTQSLSSPPIVAFTIKIKYFPRNGCRPVGLEITGTSSRPYGSSHFDATFDNGPYRNFATVSPAT